MLPSITPSLTFKPERHSYGGPGPWAGHLAFAYDLVAAERPGLLVELGTFFGESYFGFCQAIKEKSIACNCYAVDTWKGDAHGGFYSEEIYADVEAYNRTHYSSFSHLMQMTFDEALSYFSAGSIDVLHIDGHHSYESVRNNFESWIEKVRPGGIILLHDVCVRTAGFGVWRFWEELCAAFPHFAFAHSAGLGVVMKPGAQRAGDFLSELLAADSEEQARIGHYYAALAERLQWAFDSAELRKKTSTPECYSAQVFYSLGQGYSEENSVVRIVPVGERHRVTFELPAGIPAEPLRIDPADRTCIIELYEICVSADNRSVVLWKWDGTGSPPPFQVGGTARLLAGDGEITIMSKGNDPQLLLDIGGEEFQRPLELDLVLRISACVDFKGRIVPIGDADGVGTTSELSPTSVQPCGANEVSSRINEAGSKINELSSKIDGVVAEVRRTGDRLADLLTEEAARTFGQLELVRAGALAANTEMMNRVTDEAAWVHGELELLRAAAIASNGTISSNAEIMNRLTEEAARVSSELEMLRRSAQVVNTEIGELRNKLETERIRSKEFEQSWSWRVTAPARYILARLRRTRTD